MSDKKDSSGNFEPLKIETTTLKIEVKSAGDLTTKEYDLIPFHPNMADMKDLSNNNYILFPSFIKITMKDLKQAGVGDDYKKVFTNLEKFVILIKYVTSPEREEDFSLIVDQTKAKNYAMSMLQDLASDVVQDVMIVQKYEPLTDEEIISNNIGLIKSLFFPVNGRFFVLGHEYIINESKYIPPYIPSTNYNEKLKDRKNIPLSYTITVEVQLLDATNNPSAGDFSRLSCKAKKLSIANDVKDIFGSPLQGNVPEVKAVLPSMLVPTTTSKRGFGKLQIEWEERNKYVKAPTTEKEREELEKKWTPQQKKMAQIEKQQLEYNKIPPLWIKSRDELDAQMDAFIKEMNGYVAEKDVIDKTNPVDPTTSSRPSFYDDLIKAVEEKMKAATEKMFGEEGKLSDAEMITFIHNTLFSFDKQTELSTLKKKREEVTDAKYVAPFIVELTEKEKDVTALNNEYNKIRGEKGNQQELSKIQAALLKKKTDFEMLKVKFGKNGSVLTKKWNDDRKKMKDLKKSLAGEKTIEEKTILNKSVIDELVRQMKLIDEIKKSILKAKFFEGDVSELTKDEKDKFGKENRPIETVDELTSKLTSTTEEYLEIAKKLGVFNEIQGYIALVEKDLERIRILRSKSEEVKKTKDADVQSKDKILNEIRKKYTNATGVYDEAGYKTASEGLAATSAGKADKERTDAVLAEQGLLQRELGPINKVIATTKEYEVQYKAEITKLRQLKEQEPGLDTKYKKIKEEITTIETSYKTALKPELKTIGGGKTLKNPRRKIRKISKRRLMKLIKKYTKRSFRREKKHTRRHN